MESPSDYHPSPGGSAKSLNASASASNSSSSSSKGAAASRRDSGGLGRRVAQGVSKAFGWGQQASHTRSQNEEAPREREQYQPRRHQQQSQSQTRSQEQPRQPQQQQQQNQSQRRYTSLLPLVRQPALPRLSDFSTPAVPDSGWSSNDFMLGVGMVIIQEHTHKIVTVFEKEQRVWFFPRGRKDVGESLEQAALREGFEESGYTPEFMPHYASMHQPRPPSHGEERYEEPTCEPVFITIMHWPAKARMRDGKPFMRPGGEYLITWYLGIIPSNAVRQLGTGMEDEQNYEAHLLTYEESMASLPNNEKGVLRYAWAVYRATLQVKEYLAKQRELEQQRLADEGTPGSAGAPTDTRAQQEKLHPESSQQQRRAQEIPGISNEVEEDLAALEREGRRGAFSAPNTQSLL